MSEKYLGNKVQESSKKNCKDSYSFKQIKILTVNQNPKYYNINLEIILFPWSDNSHWH